MKNNRPQNNNQGQGQNQGRRSNVPPRMQTFDSNGPDVRIRGTAWQVHEKYQALAKDAASAGDLIMAENYLQHAEHYQRIINSFNIPSWEQPQPNRSDSAGEGMPQEEADVTNLRQPQPQPQQGQGQGAATHQNGQASDRTAHGPAAQEQASEDLGLPMSIFGGAPRNTANLEPV